MHVFIYKTVIVLQRKTSKCEPNFNLNQINSQYINYNQYIQKIENKLRLKAINHAYSKLEEQVTKSVKKNKNNFITVIGAKLAMNIR